MYQSIGIKPCHEIERNEKGTLIRAYLHVERQSYVLLDKQNIQRPLKLKAGCILHIAFDYLS